MVSSITSVFCSAKEEKVEKNSIEMGIKSFTYIAQLHDESIHGLFQCEVCHRLDASRLVHDEHSALDSSMDNIYRAIADVELI